MVNVLHLFLQGQHFLQTLLLSTLKLRMGFRFAYLNSTMTHSKPQGPDHAYFDGEYILNDDRKGTLLTLVHSKGQVQGHAYFDCKYLYNNDR